MLIHFLLMSSATKHRHADEVSAFAKSAGAFWGVMGTGFRV